ncbi:Uncharacterized protein Fot_11694 [Forsythia ovata]|uniref:Uncharacterized protein n=1 Tax=Forsythia ovata TaxID=205694 RepID=A0ABD1WKF1_9LAMI
MDPKYNKSRAGHRENIVGGAEDLGHTKRHERWGDPVPKFKIRSGRVVGEKEDISSQPLVLCTVSVPEVAVLQASEAIVGTFTAIPLALGIAVGILSVIPLEETLLLSKDIRRSSKKNMVVNDEGETAMPRGGTEDDGEAKNSRKARRGWEALSWRVGKHAPRS